MTNAHLPIKFPSTTPRLKAGSAGLYGRPLFFSCHVSTLSPTTPRTIVCIDGFNFYYGAVRGSPYKWLDFQRFFTLLRPHDDIRRIHYFTAMVSGPTAADQQVFLRALATRPLLNIVLGNYKVKRVKCILPACTYSGNRLFKTVEEKRTDVNIAVHMLEDAYEDRCDQFVLVSGDSDLVPAVNAVRRLGKKVLLYIPARDPTRGAAVELRSVADSSKVLPLYPLLKHSQFPATIPDGSGGFLSKPASW